MNANKAMAAFKPLSPWYHVQIVSEVEEAVAAEEGLESEEHRVWLRASAYDCYDMMVMCVYFRSITKNKGSGLEYNLYLIIPSPPLSAHLLISRPPSGATSLSTGSSRVRQH